MSFLQLNGKSFLITGIANKKSIAYHVARLLLSEGAHVLCSVRNEERQQSVKKLLPECEIYVCDVEHEDQIKQLAATLHAKKVKLAGLLHSMAFANYKNGFKPFHETSKKDFLQCVDVSCYSLIALSGALKDLFTPEASVVAVSISTTTMAAENYGYMAPAKAALDSALVFLAKSFSETSRVRFNAVRAGLLKTNSSAGIPGYVDSYLFAEQATLRKQALKTEEVAQTTIFLLSQASSGINAQGIVLDAGMSANYFDKSIVRKASGRSGEPS